MQLGDWQLDVVSGGRFSLDGGSMFGVVPAALWQREHPQDDQNRIRLATNCILARRADITLLVDTGYGTKHSQEDTQRFALEADHSLTEQLRTLGCGPDDVDLVTYSHLHFDHAGGGTTIRPDGAPHPTFPNARYLIQRAEWQDATTPSPQLRGAYLAEDLLAIDEHDQLELIEGDVEIVPGLRAVCTGGHTRGHQALVFESGGESAIYMGDICPTTSHLRDHWCMAFDLFLYETRTCKSRLLAEAAETARVILFDHDPQIAAARITCDERGRARVADVLIES